MTYDATPRIEPRWRYVCRTCDATWLGLPVTVVMDGLGEPPTPDRLTEAFGLHLRMSAPQGTVPRTHDIHLETYWRVVP